MDPSIYKVRVLNLLVPDDSDNGAVTYPNPTTEVYEFKKGSTHICNITIVYTTPTKDFISTWERT